VKSQHALVFVVITALLDSVGFGIIMPVIPQLIMDVSGENLSAAARFGGWMMFAYAGMQFFMAPVLGNLSDRFGRRPILLVSLLVLGIDYLIMWWAPSLVWLLLGRIVAGAAAATHSTCGAFIADISEPEDRASNFGLMGAAFGMGFIIGPVIGGFSASTGQERRFSPPPGRAGCGPSTGSACSCIRPRRASRPGSGCVRTWTRRSAPRCWRRDPAAAPPRPHRVDRHGQVDDGRVLP